MAGPDLVFEVLDPAMAPSIAARVAGIDPWQRMGFTTDGLLEYLKRDDAAASRIALRSAGEISGIAVLRRPWLRGPYIEILCVFPGFSGKGVGSAFLDWLYDDARMRNERNLWVAVSDFNTQAYHFYHKAGFAHCVDLPELVGAGYTEKLMRKQLSV